MRKSIELKNEKAQLTEQYRAILDKAAAEKRSTNTEEKAQLAKMDSRFDELDADIKMYERQEQRESEGSARNSAGGRRDAVDPDNRQSKDPATGGVRASKEYHEAFLSELMGRPMVNASADIRMALQSDSDEGGGYLVASEQFANRLIEVVDNEVFIRGLATKTTVMSATSLGIPSRTADVDDSDWTSELATGTDDTGLKFGKRELKPHPLSKRIKISKKLLRMNSSVQDIVLKRLGYKKGVSQEKAFLLGSGVQQPLGVFTPSNDGIDTSRDVSTGSTTGFTSADPLIDALYTLKAQYQRTANWIFHRDVVRLIRKLKDSYGQYLWQPGITAGEPDRILNRPFFMSEYAPNTLTTGQYVGIIGDFTKYEIVDALDMEIQALWELYAESNQVGFIARSETDGMPVLAEAFVRLKTA